MPSASTKYGGSQLRFAATGRALALADGDAEWAMCGGSIARGDGAGSGGFGAASTAADDGGGGGASTSSIAGGGGAGAALSAGSTGSAGTGRAASTTAWSRACGAAAAVRTPVERRG
ncbi:MAG TPA: hypothetical protein VHB21_02285, partial [Minicystis sp.]|nr:hypothetical protein [Minicystis sp.]